MYFEINLYFSPHKSGLTLRIFLCWSLYLYYKAKLPSERDDYFYKNLKNILCVCFVFQGILSIFLNLLRGWEPGGPLAMPPISFYDLLLTNFILFLLPQPPSILQASKNQCSIFQVILLRLILNISVKGPM